MICSQNNETGILEILKLKVFFAVQPWWVESERKFVKFFLRILHFDDGIFKSFLKKIIKNYLNLSFYDYQEFSKIPIGNKKL